MVGSPFTVPLFLASDACAEGHRLPLTAMTAAPAGTSSDSAAGVVLLPALAVRVPARLPGCLPACLPTRLPCCLAALLPGCIAAWLPGCLSAWLPGCAAAWLPCVPASWPVSEAAPGRAPGPQPPASKPWHTSTRIACNYDE